MITICATKHGCYFDKYPALAKIIQDEISGIQKYFKNISIIDSIIMPNHVHLIIAINYQIQNITLGKIIGVLKGKIINKWLKTI